MKRNPEKVVSLKEYRDRKGAKLRKQLGSGPQPQPASFSNPINLIHDELHKRDQLIKEITTDLNNQIDVLIRRQDALYKLIQNIIKTTQVKE